MKQPRQSISRVLLLIGVLLGMQLACGLGSEPGPGAAAVLTHVAPAATQSQSITLPPAVPEQRMLTLEYPPTIRAGDSDVVRLTLELDDQGGLTPTVSAAGNVTQGQVLSIPNVYETHTVMAEARLDLAGVDVRPGDTISESLLPGQKTTFYWSVLPQDVGKFKGTVWFFLRFIPRAGGAESRQALSAQLIEIESTSILGLKAGLTRWLGLGGTALGTILGLPFLEQAILWLRKKVTRRS